MLSINAPFIQLNGTRMASMTVVILGDIEPRNARMVSTNVHRTSSKALTWCECVCVLKCIPRIQKMKQEQ